jgi:hypothetical protein
MRRTVGAAWRLCPLTAARAEGTRLYLLMLRPSANVVLSVCLPVVSSLLGRLLGKMYWYKYFFLPFPFSMFPSKWRGLSGLSTIRTVPTSSCTSGPKLSFAFSRFRGLFNSGCVPMATNQSFLPAWRGERRMKDAVHCRVHRSVHLHGERKLLGTERLHATRGWISDMGKTQCWAGATPLRCH